MNPDDNSKTPMNPWDAVQLIAEAGGGTIKEAGVVGDSGFAVVSFPLREDHWIYGKDIEDFDYPPMPFKTGEDETTVISCFPPLAFEAGPAPFGPFGSQHNYVSVPLDPARTQRLTKSEFAAKITEAARYAVRASTMKGKEMDFDPDALVQNMVVGMLGYWTADGLTGTEDDWANPPQYRKQK